MTWYGVHVIMAVRFKDGNQNAFPAWENVYLVHATSSDEAEAKAAAIGRENEGDSSGTFNWDDRPATWVYVGVRKIIEISNALAMANEPSDGVEITYSTLEFKSEDTLKQYASGESTELTAVE
ncbi:MAG: DUF4288 domain-containing protein [Methylococcales bacterium]